MVMPALAIVGGVITFWLAATTNNSMVVDDYYREGKAINRQLERDRAAADLGLGGELRRRADGTALLGLSAKSGTALPPFVTIRLVHATRSELDRVLSLASTGAGRYASPEVQLPDEGRWNVLVEDPERRWRLTGSTSGFGEPLLFGQAAR
jgi:hypothetical protein